MKRRFEDKVAVVTGGNSGIGLATARAFVREGAKVAITGRNATTLEAAGKELGTDALAIKADMSRLPEIVSAFDRIKSRFGRIDALFVNAGIGKFVPFEEVTEAVYDEMMAVNLKGAFFTIQKAVPLLTRGSGVVLNASINAHIGMANTSVYGATKAAVVSLAGTLSNDLIAKGIRVNVVSPGPIATPIFGRLGLPEDQARQMKEFITSRVPLKRFGDPEEIAAAVVFLCAAESAFVVGTELVIDGGMTHLWS